MSNIAKDEGGGCTYKTNNLYLKTNIQLKELSPQNLTSWLRSEETNVNKIKQFQPPVGETIPQKKHFPHHSEIFPQKCKPTYFMRIEEFGAETRGPGQLL